jgi:hypothetical protein
MQSCFACMCGWAGGARALEMFNQPLVLSLKRPLRLSVKRPEGPLRPFQRVINERCS